MAKIGAEGAHICVVCTDIAKSNVVAIRDRPELQQFRGGREGAGSISLDFAIYDANADQSITLLDKGVTLSPSAPSTNPILVIANYVFDSLKYDVYRFSSDGCLQEGLVSTCLTLTLTLTLNLNLMVRSSVHVVRFATGECKGAVSLRVRLQVRGH